MIDIDTENTQTIKQSEWFGLYNESWQGEIVPEAFSHPAKYGRAMIRQIYQHMIDQGYIKPGDSIVDPFGGVGLGALDAMRHGLHWHGCELEPRFVELGNQNLGLWQARYSGWFANWGTAVLHQGDSRNLAQVIGAGDGCVSSPPFLETGVGGDNNVINLNKQAVSKGRPSNLSQEARGLSYGQTPGQLGSMPAGDFDAAISSPPYANSVNKESNGIDASKFAGRDKNRDFGNGNSNIETAMKYGRTDGQLGAMSEGSFAAAVSSPPYGDAISNETSGIDWGKAGRPDRIKPSANRNNTMTDGVTSYGRTPGNLGNLRMDAAVSSPPYEDAISSNGSGIDWSKRKAGAYSDSDKAKIRAEELAADYGSTPGNIGNDTAASFWTAARDIVAQVYEVLKPGGYAVWVTGDFVRNKKRVLFGQQWLELCTAVGFEPVEWIVAWKTEYKGSQLDIFGDTHHKQVDRVSFFRRLANEKNPDNAILNEDVIIVRKPL